MKKLAVTVFFSALVCLSLVGYGFSQSPFYQGKTITVIQGLEPGGTGDLRRKALFPFLQKHIPGNPQIISEYMPGGGGRKAANYIFRTARPDGLTIGGVSAPMIANAILGAAGVQYDIDKFAYLGSPVSVFNYIFISRKEAGLNSLEKLRSAAGVRIGAQEVGHDIYITGRLFAYLLTIREPKFVVSYSGPEVDLALMRGELDARATSLETFVQRNADWLEKGLVDLHAIVEIPKGSRPVQFARLPELEAFVKADKDRKLLMLYRAFRLVGTPYILPPGTPKAQVQVLQDAMRKAFKDPGFHREFKRLAGFEVTPLMPEEQEKAIRELPRDAEVIELFKKLAGPDPLPTR